MVRWKQTGIYFKLEEAKRIHVEPRTADDFDETLSSFHSTINDGLGAVFFAVYRGKVCIFT